MISHCPHCGRGVSTDETIIHTAAGWVPSLCCVGENGPHDDGSRERVKNHPFFYVTILDDRGRRGWLTGPFQTYDDARDDMRRAKDKATNADPWAAFCAFGIASSVAERKTVFGVPS